MNRVTAPGAVHRPPPMFPPISCDHNFNVHLQPRLITPSRYISWLAPFRTPRPHSNSLDHNLWVYLPGSAIPASKCAQPCHTRESPNLLVSCLQVCMIIGCNCLSPNSPDYCFQVYLQTHSNTPSKFARSWPLSVSPNSLDHDHWVHL